jgi:hypothetical protein
MAILVPNVGEVVALSNFLNISAPEELVVRLYSSNTTPIEAHTDSDYTEVTGGDYTPIQLNPVNWVLTPDNPSEASYPQITFAFTGAIGGGGNVYGYFVTQEISGTLLWAEKFVNGPYPIANDGDEIRIAITITLD